jgi:ketosteroid isomerase-like protein
VLTAGSSSISGRTESAPATEANDGQPYDNSYAWVMRIADGKVIDGRAFYDSISFNDLWRRVAPV